MEPYLEGRHGIGMKIALGEKIICSNGHECGFFRTPVENGAAIALQDLEVHDTQQSGGPGFLCRECGETVVRQVDHHWQVHTQAGWTG
jgi:hypothetical protein